MNNQGDTLCRQYETLHEGMKSCAEIYKNPEGENMTNSEYFLLTDYTMALFSVKENEW